MSRAPEPLLGWAFPRSMSPSSLFAPEPSLSMVLFRWDLGVLFWKGGAFFFFNQYHETRAWGLGIGHRWLWGGPVLPVCAERKCLCLLLVYPHYFYR